MKKLLLIFTLTLGFFQVTQSQTARVQVIHNSPDAALENVDVYLNDAIVIANFKFRNATAFLNLPSGTPLNIKITPANSTSSAAFVYEQDFTFEPSKTYVIIADGILSTTGYAPAKPFILNVYPFGRVVATVSPNTDILVHHGSTDAPTVDVVRVSTDGPTTLVDNISYGEFKNYIILPTANYKIEVRDASGETTVRSYDLPLAALNLNGAAVTAVASGFLDPSNNSNGPAFGIWVAKASGGALIPLPTSKIARVQVVHNSPDAAAAEVDVYVNGELAIDDFTFRTATPFLNLPADTQINIAVAPANSTSVADAIAAFPVTLTADETYIVVADGIVSPSGYEPNQPFGLNVYAMGRETATTGSNTDILVHHGGTDAPTVDIVETGVGEGTLVDDISYGEFQGYLELATDDYVIEVKDASGAVVVATYEMPLATLNLQGAAVTALASGFLDPSKNSNGPAFGIWVALPAGGNLIALPMVPLSVNESDLNTFKLYPNPVSQNLNIAGLNLENVRLDIIDIQGRKLNTNSYKLSDSNSLDVSQLANGIYHLIITDDQNNSSVRKFIKK
ncbi:putative secreted protein (Por secretion system target) [Gelidibacter algens]|uniref:Putative secreted protein (Por secretion system target) n=1 Tax=Gelidibacter algens TaxID=49280 RepID=A0A1A7QZR2_9FLAO|nr:DUF4397 domain-containing protein [Gelidibacter algens]OBX25505.1 hypothetical protein A9996_09360 [Gelidibacter algens]RAJ22229.1 putative secreted protein (Por secretion system target) [Gelidibacter algens]